MSARRSQEEMFAAIRAAAVAEFQEVGLARMSMVGIAERSGAARTSIYRHWPGPTDVLLDALEHEFPEESVSAGTDNLRGDLIDALTHLVSWSSSPTAQVVAAIVAERERYPDLAHALYEQVFDAKGGRFTRTVLHHYAEHGDLDPDLVTDVVVDIGEALVLKHLADTGSPPDREQVERIVDQAILPAVGQPRTR